MCLAGEKALGIIIVSVATREQEVPSYEYTEAYTHLVIVYIVRLEGFNCGRLKRSSTIMYKCLAQ